MNNGRYGDVVDGESKFYSVLVKNKCIRMTFYQY